MLEKDYEWYDEMGDAGEHIAWIKLFAITPERNASILLEGLRVDSNTSSFIVIPPTGVRVYNPRSQSSFPL